MKSIILLMIFVLQHLFITINADKPMLGIAPCMYAGDFDKYGYYCPYVPMPLAWIPKECTSFVYDGLSCNSNLTFSFPKKDEKNMKALGSSDKPLYLYYGYETPKAWIKALNFTNATTEAENLKTFLSIFNVTGLILKNLNYDYSSDLDLNIDKCFYNNLKQYVTTMKQIIVNLNIGLYVNASNMIFYSDNPTSPNWFDFKVLNDVMDYYIIGFDKFNPCNEYFKGGIVPMKNVFRSSHSLTTFADVLSSSTIATDKMYLEFLATPTPNDTTTEYLPTCCVTYKKLKAKLMDGYYKQKPLPLYLPNGLWIKYTFLKIFYFDGITINPFCEADNYKKFWCADSLDSFYGKGKFAKKIQAQGIVTKYIDAIDPTAKCDCDSKNKFITFSAMLRGFLGSAPITDCAKLNSFSVQCRTSNPGAPLALTPIYLY